MKLNPTASNVLSIIFKNAVNAVITNTSLMVMLPRVFTFHSRDGLINLTKLTLTAIGTREWMVWGPKILKWSTTNGNSDTNPKD